ncbi:hypothetical protein [Luteolibacter sp. Populi]|uniref:hypothetical protein n=1 Tax=Luteolibacter sp. Populi TaxID=3230487 RepID=UPI0034656854
MKLFTPLAFACFAGSALGAVVNFDFNYRDAVPSMAPELDPAPYTYSGLGAAPDSGANTKWNSVRRNSSNTFSTAGGINTNPVNSGYPTVDSSNTASAVTISLTQNNSIGHGRNYGDQELGGAGHGYDNLMGDYLLLSSPAAGTVLQAAGTIGGLVAGNSYQIYFYGQGASNGTPTSTSGQNSLFGITSTLGGTQLYTQQQTGWDGVAGGNGTLTEGVEYVKFTATANGSGQIFFTWANVVTGVGGNVDVDKVAGTGTGSPFAALNAIQVVLVPEPGAAILGSLGLAGILLRRRRGRQSAE